MTSAPACLPAVSGYLSPCPPACLSDWLAAWLPACLCTRVPAVAALGRGLVVQVPGNPTVVLVVTMEHLYTGRTCIVTVLSFVDGRGLYPRAMVDAVSMCNVWA